MSATPVDHPRPTRSHAVRGRSVRARASGWVRLFDEYPDLRSATSQLTGTGARAAREVQASSWLLKTGAWDPEANPPLEEPDSSYFVLDGLLLSRVLVGSRCSGELLAAGDIFRTDHPDTHGYATVASDRSFRVLAPAHIAVLAGRRISELHTLPGFASWFQQRLTEQAHSLNLRLAINQVPQLATRLQLLLWHLADRLGRRCPNGALIPFFLSHEVLAECVSAQRTSVLAAMHELEQSGAVERNEEGLYLLHAEPPSEFT